MNIVKKIEEQMTNNVDPSFNEELSIIQGKLAKAWEIYDAEHLAHNVPPGEELYHMGKFLDFAIDHYYYDLLELDDQFIDWAEDPVELDEEMREQEEYYSNLLKI
jgi:hypothetical protein